MRGRTFLQWRPAGGEIQLLCKEMFKQGNTGWYRYQQCSILLSPEFACLLNKGWLCMLRMLDEIILSPQSMAFAASKESDLAAVGRVHQFPSEPNGRL